MSETLQDKIDAIYSVFSKEHFHQLRVNKAIQELRDEIMKLDTWESDDAPNSVVLRSDVLALIGEKK